jgi:hypothetical protein
MGENFVSLVAASFDLRGFSPSGFELVNWSL